MPTFPWLPEAERERCSEDHRHYIKGSPCLYRDLPPAPPQHTPTPGSSASALQARTRRLCRSASALPEANSCSGLGGKRGGARLTMKRTSPERAGAGVYLSHLLMARGRQAGTTLSFTSLLLPQPESTQPPKAASPVTTTTNKQPPARSHCAGARQRREQRSAAGADGWRHHGALSRQSQPRLSPEGFLAPFLSVFSPPLKD